MDAQLAESPSHFYVGEYSFNDELPRFGRNREGDFNALEEMGKMFGFEVIALDAR